MVSGKKFINKLHHLAEKIAGNKYEWFPANENNARILAVNVGEKVSIKVQNLLENFIDERKYNVEIENDAVMSANFG